MDGTGLSEKVVDTNGIYEGKENYIFISYSHANNDIVLPFIKRLQADGHRVWYDDGINPGSEWPETIAQHLNDCAVFVALISNTYVDSFNCKRELDFAVRKRKAFLAVFLEETQMPLGMEMQISTVQAMNYFSNSDPDFFERLYSSGMLDCCNVNYRGGNPAGETPAENVTLTGDNTVNENNAATGYGTVNDNSMGNTGMKAGMETVQNDKAGEIKNIKTKEAGKKKRFKILIPILAVVFVLLGLISLFIGLGVRKVIMNSVGNSSGTDRKTLALKNVIVTDEELRKASRSKELSYIEIEGCELAVTDSTVWNEVVTEDARHIKIANCGLTDAEAAIIFKNASGAASVNLSNNNIKDASFLEACPNLYSIDLSGNQIEDTSFLNNDRLDTVNLSNNNISAIEKRKYENLRELSVDNNKLTNLDFLETAVHLKRLSADNNQLESVDILKNCILLTHVSLSGNKLEDVSALSKSKDNIIELNLAQNKITDISGLMPMPALVRLCVDDNALEELYLTGSEKVEYLSARNNKIDSFSGYPAGISYMDLADNQLSGEMDLSGYPKLRYVFLENNMISGLTLGSSSPVMGYYSVFNNPVSRFDPGAEKSSYEIYLSYHSALKETLGNKFCSKLYLSDCPYDLRVSLEDVWGTYSLKFLEKNEMIDAVGELRKGF